MAAYGYDDSYSGDSTSGGWLDSIGQVLGMAGVAYSDFAPSSANNQYNSQQYQLQAMQMQNQAKQSSTTLIMLALVAVAALFIFKR